MATGGSSVPAEFSHGDFVWDEGRQTHSPPDRNRTLREDLHAVTWHAGHDMEDGSRYMEESEARAAHHQYGDADIEEMVQEERPSTRPWCDQFTSGAQRGADESARGHSRQESENSGVVTFRLNKNKKIWKPVHCPARPIFSSSTK